MNPRATSCRHKIRSTPWIALAVVLTLSGCGKSPNEPGSSTIDLSQGLRTADPATQGFNPDRLDAALDHARSVSGLLGLTVCKGGRLVAEAYFSGNDETELNHVRSVTKTVISILIGIAIDEGFIPGIQEPIAGYLQMVEVGEDKLGITIQHLLTMTGGFEWFESGSVGYSEWIQSFDHIRYVVDKPMSAAPGQVWNYNSGAVHLLSVILTQATGMSTSAFAEEYLFRPLGILQQSWQINSEGYYNGGAGLQLSGHSMAKIGILFMQDGFSGAQRLLSPEWVRESTKVQQSLTWSNSVLSNVNYGYLWWLHNGAPEPAYFAWGHGGQFIYCVPDLDLVITTSAVWAGLGDSVDAQVSGILDLIVNHIVPSARKAK